MKDEETSLTSGRPQPLDFNAAKDFSNYEELPSKGYCRLFRAQRPGAAAGLSLQGRLPVLRRRDRGAGGQGDAGVIAGQIAEIKGK